MVTILCRFAVDDLERNDGEGKPYYMNKELLKILGKRNERYSEIEGRVQSAGKKSKKKTEPTTGF